MRQPVDWLMTRIRRLYTMDAGPVPRRGAGADHAGLIEDGAIAIRGGRIIAAGPTGEIEARFEAGEGGSVRLPRSCVLPGFIDAHTHVLFAGSREAEFEMRLAGRSYMEIAAAGGGIASSVRAFRAASDEELLAQTSRRLDEMLARGVTTIEAKSGYGLNVEHELRALRLLDRLQAEHPIDIVSTFLGAHEFPPEYRDRREEYVRIVCEEMIPLVASSTRVRFCDVFCEEGVFTPSQARVILRAGIDHGLKPRLHADEFRPSGASELAGELHALSADHLMAASDDGLRALRDSGTVAILLPATSLSLGMRDYAPARRMIEMGIPIALATDCNPGSSMTTNLPLVVALGVLMMNISLSEALNAVTANPAASLDLVDDVGRLIPGARADLQVFDAESPAVIVYHLGDFSPDRVMKGGVWVALRGRRV